MQVLRRIVNQPFVLAIALAGVLTMTGCGDGGSSSSGTNTTATPTFNPGAGSYNTSKAVTIADATPGAVLYCTTDGTTPTTSSPQCSQPTTVFKTEFLQAIAVAPGMSPSAVASAGYTINLNAAATPTFSPAGGSYASAVTVLISDGTAGANIYYTTDGSVPTAASTLYTGPITVSKTTTLSAIAMASGFANSGVISAAYVIGTATAAPVISPAGGSFTAAQAVTMTDATPGASIYYTTDGSIPSASSTQYSGTAISVSTTETINAIAIASGNASPITTAAFTININTPAAAPPTFNPNGGTFSSSQTVLLSDTTPGASIFYTVDGTTPSASSTPYANSITVSSSETIKAIATASGFSPSAAASATFTINQAVAPPTFTPPAGTYSSAQAVTISDATAGATIYYTLDGSQPSTSSSKYSSPITVDASKTLSAIATLGNATSSVASAAYTINLGPTFSGTVTSGTLPVSGAQVQMYVAGAGGYSSSATALLTTPVKTDATGAFSLSYNCPAAESGDLVYLVASGGSTGSGASNSSLSFMAALGSCNATLPQTVVVNEVTTVASVYALSQFMTSATNVGSSIANYSTALGGAGNGLANAFAAVTNLVDLSTGRALDHTPAYPGNLMSDPNILNNSTVPQARINTLANTLNACAADGSGCSTLFTAATAGSGSAPADTLQAILNIAQNPGNNASTVYNVAAGTGPFMPALSAAPVDWTLALTFTGGGLGFAPGIPLAFEGSSTFFGQFINTAMAIDGGGNIWVTGLNYDVPDNNSADLGSGMVAKFSNLGAPLTPASKFDSSNSPALTFGGFIPVTTQPANGRFANSGTQSSQGIAIDPSGNAWVVGGNGDASDGTGALTEITPGLTTALLELPLGGFGGISPTSVAIDGVGNVWAMGSDGFGDPFTIEMFNQNGQQQITNNGSSNPNNLNGGYFGAQALIFDSNAAALWGYDPNASTLYQIDPGTGNNTVDYFPNGDGNLYTPLVAAAANADRSPGNVYGCAESGGQTLDAFNVSSTSILTSYPIPTNRGCGSQMVMDGDGHIFAVTGGSTPGIIDEFTVTGSGLTMISPVATGYTGTSSGETPTINPDPNVPVVRDSGASKKSVAGAAIDGSGNLWVLNANTGTVASPGNVLVEYIGIAAPIVTPTSAAISFGEVGVRPQ